MKKREGKRKERRMGGESREKKGTGGEGREVGEWRKIKKTGQQ